MATMNTVAVVVQPPPSRGPFSRVPLEIFLRITSHLSTQDLLAMRLTCTTAEQSLFHTFTGEFFNKRQFMITSESLQALVGIASCPRLSDCITHVVIGLDRYAEESTPRFPQPLTQDPNQVARNNHIARRALDQRALLNSGAARDMLEEAFSKLPRLSTIELRDYNAGGRRRNNDDEKKVATWSSYGNATARAECGNQPCYPDDRFTTAPPHWSSEILSTMLAAAARANANLTYIDVNTIKPVNAINADGLHFVPYLAPKLDTLLANLERCFLHVKFCDPQVPVMTRSGPRLTKIWGLCNFLNKLRNVKHLRLNLARIAPDQTAEFLSWFAETNHTTYELPAGFLPNSLRQMPEPFNVPIERLDLGKFSSTPKALLMVIQKFRKSLIGLSMQRIHLDPELETGAFDTANLSSNKWSKLLEKIRAMPDLNLTEFKITLVTQRLPGQNSYMVKFQETGSPYATQQRHYKGPDFKAFLASIDAEMEALWPKPESDRESDSDSEEDGDTTGDSEDDE